MLLRLLPSEENPPLSPFFKGGINITPTSDSPLEGEEKRRGGIIVEDKRRGEHVFCPPLAKGGTGGFWKHGSLHIFVIFALVFFLSGCTSLFFQPQKEHVDNPIAKLFLPEDVFFKTPDGLTLHGWFFKARDNRGSILVLHGNAENLSTHVNSVLWLVQEGFNVFIFDYRGYGKSEGKPTVQGVHLDAEAALETLLTLPGVDKENIAVLGQSIGGAVAVYLVPNSPYKQHVKALIIDSAFSGYRLIAREKANLCCITRPFQYPLSFLVSDTYSPVKWIKNVSPVPVLIIHGEADPVVPMHHGRILYDAALQPKEFWETAAPGHTRSFADATIRKNLVTYLSARFQTH